MYYFLVSFRWRSALLWRTFFTTAVVAVVLRSLIEFCRTGKCGLFGQGGLIMFDVNSTKATYSTPDLLAVMFLGVIGGVFGSFYNYCVDKVLRTYSIINEYAPTASSYYLLLIFLAILFVNSYALYFIIHPDFEQLKRNMEKYIFIRIYISRKD
jgi:H+/Cl- antiporter ClcA